MSARPIHTKGKLQQIDSSWHIVLDEAHPSYEEGMTAELVLWDSRSEGGRSEVEEIARIQQLEPAIVALGLASEGILEGSDFGKKIKFQN
ncbi:MAG: hypothetical protein ABI778_06965 [Ignavibacteriota bacterium]